VQPKAVDYVRDATTNSYLRKWQAKPATACSKSSYESDTYYPNHADVREAPTNFRRNPWEQVKAYYYNDEYYSDDEYSRETSCTQNRAVPTHHCTPDAPRWCSRLALDVGEGQKQTRCIDLPVRRRGGVERGENGVIIHGEKAPLLHYSEPGCSDPPLHSRRPPIGVPASPWTWAKARSKLGALIRLCGDGAVSNEARMGSLYTGKKHPSCTTQNRAVPTHHCTPNAPPLAFPPRPGRGRRPEAN
jgi:hypothetical protein